MITDDILKIAVAELGQKEVDGPANNLHIVNYAKEAGFSWINDDETPWCSIFVNWVVKKAGIKGTNKTNARSWLLTGRTVDNNPEPGDVVIFWREQPDSWKGHVGFFLGFSADKSLVYCVGGNQGDQVSLSAVPSDTVLGFRRISDQKKIILHDNILRKGDTGDDVKKLQDALKGVGIECGTSDGIFGLLTETAVKKLQSMKTGLNISGVFNTDTRKLLSEILNG
jgi:uncharacterized protein (TIGR02594 family)